MLPRIARLFAVPVLAAWTAATAADDEVRRVSANGYEFAYVEAGRGEPVVLVHGGLQDHRLREAHMLPR